MKQEKYPHGMLVSNKVLLCTMPVICSLGLLVLATTAEVSGMKPSGGDKCPVCGMFVSKYPDFLVKVAFEEGAPVYCDGPKDMFRLVHDKNRYLPAGAERKIGEILVTDYYQVRAIDAREAWYVIGSDVLGPMGRELIPFLTEEDAREFMKDHGGTAVIRFGDVTSDLLRGLD